MRSRDTLATAPGGAIVRTWRYWAAVARDTARARSTCCRRALLAGAARPLSAACDRRGAPPRDGAIRARGEPLVELRPVAARAAAVPPPLSALHGEGGAVLVPARLGDQRPEAASRCAAASATRGDRDGDATLPRGARRRDVPGGDAPQEGAAEEARGALAHRRRADRARGRRAARAGRHPRHRPARAARAAARRVRHADRARRPRHARPARRRPTLATDRLREAIASLEESLS